LAADRGYDGKAFRLFLVWRGIRHSTQLGRHWFRALRRRGQKRRINCKQMDRHIRRWLPSTKILHPWPTTRFDLRTQGKSRVR
jgi:RNA-directed DNA polymerase